MDQLNEEQRRSVIGQFYKVNKTLGKCFTVKNFLSMNIQKSTIYDIIKRVDNDLPLKRKTGSGNKAKK